MRGVCPARRPQSAKACRDGSAHFCCSAAHGQDPADGYHRASWRCPKTPQSVSWIMTENRQVRAMIIPAGSGAANQILTARHLPDALPFRRSGPVPAHGPGRLFPADKLPRSCRQRPAELRHSGRLGSVMSSRFSNMSSGRIAVTPTFGASTSCPILRSTATEAMI